tara:strand:+ start:2106 stop:3224 length:1119 start_codon:yes stop_codon:yes gene_type:complete
MATVYKNFNGSDVVHTRTLLHEAIPVTGSIVSGTYGGNGVVLGSEPHIKKYAHGMFESVFDYPFLSSSANHIFDITAGYSSVSELSGATNTQNAKKIAVYNQMAQVLAGYDHAGNIRRFDEDGNLASGTKLDEVFFINFSRLLTKDEIKKGTFQLDLGVDAAFSQNTTVMTEVINITDASGSNGYYVNSPAGEYGILYATNSAGPDILKSHNSFPVGLIYYQAGIAVLSASVFNDNVQGGIINDDSGSCALYGLEGTPVGFQEFTGSTIPATADGIRNRVKNIQFDNTTELNSAIHFCRVNHNEYNYSANPTYLTGSKIKVKGNNRKNLPVSYITSVGLYSADRELLAVAKLSEPLKKDPTMELTLKVRLDY